MLAALIAILLVAAGLRGLYLAELVRNPTFGDPAVDAQYHDYWARGLATGNWTPPEGCGDPLIRTRPFLRPPGYPYFLAIIYRVIGPGYVGAAIVQMAMGVLSALVGFLFARRWFDDATALVFAALLGVYWIFIYYEGELLEPVLLVLLGLLLIYALSTWAVGMTFAKGLLAGVLMGLFAVSRPNVLLFLGPVLLWAFWMVRRQDPGGRRGLGRAAGGLVVGTALIVAPVAIRNYIVGRDLVLISANSGVNLWIGNNDRANGAFVAAPGLEDFDTCFSYPAIVRSVERRVGRPMRYSEVSAFFARQAWDWIRAHPMLELKLLGYRTLLFWGPVEMHHNTVEAAERANSAVLRGTLLTFPIAFSLFWIGTAMFVANLRRAGRAPQAPGPDVGRQTGVVVLILLFLASYFVSFLPFFVVAQYRAPVVPFLLLMAAYAVVRFARLAWAVAFPGTRSRSGDPSCTGLARWAAFRLLLVWTSVLAIVTALASTDFSGHEVDFAKWHYDRGGSLLKRGRIDDAIREFDLAVRGSDCYPDAYAALGTALTRKGEFAKAVGAFQTALRMRPDSARIHVALGEALEGQRRIEDAVREYQTAIRCDPGYIAAYVNLGALLQDCGRLEEAIQAYQQAIRLAPETGLAYCNLAVVLYHKGRYAEAWDAVRQARRCGEDLPPGFLQALGAKMRPPGR